MLCFYMPDLWMTREIMVKQTIKRKYGWDFLNYKLKKENVDQTQLDVILSGKIPGYLKVAAERKKEKVTSISYEITDCEPLGQFLSAHVMYRKLFVSIALEMVDALIMCGKRHLFYAYIKTDYNDMYIDKNRLEIKFQYYPIVGMSNNEPMVDFLRKFPNYCFFAPQEQTSYVTEYTDYLSNLRKPFNLVDFRAFLVQLDEDLAKKYNSQNVSSSAEKEPVGQDFTGNKNAIYANQDGDHHKIYITPISLASGGQKNMISGAEISARPRVPVNDAPKPAAYPEHQPSSGHLSVMPDYHSKYQNPGPIGQQQSSGASQGTTVLGAAPYEDHETTVLGSASVDDGTTPLGGSYVPQNDLLQKRATMTRLRTNEERVINKDIFLIGKNASQVDFVISDNSTISRTHATISRKGGSFFLKDNHSLNGTYVNGEKVDEHDEIELFDGTKILLSDEEFVFGIDEMVR